MNKNITLEDVADSLMEKLRLELHTALPGKVVSFNDKDNTVSVQPMIQQVMDDGKVLDLPVLTDVPVQFPRGGQFVITFPIAEGDEGQIIFNERCIDGWWESGSESTPMDYRQHDYSDATFIAGISSKSKVVKDVALDAVVMRNLANDAYVKIDEGGVITIDGEKLIVKCESEFEKDALFDEKVTINGDVLMKSMLTVMKDAFFLVNVTVSNVLTAMQIMFSSMGGAGGTGVISGDMTMKDGSLSTENVNIVMKNGDITADDVSLKGHKHKYEGGNTEKPNKGK